MTKKAINTYLSVFYFLLIQSVPLSGLQVNLLSYEGDFKPGETREVQMTLINDRDVFEKIDLKLCDYASNHEGQHFFEEPGKMERTNASWIVLNQEHILLEPREQRDVFYTINIPKDKTLQGSYWSALLIEPADPIEQPVKSDTGFTLAVKIRYAHQIVTTLGKGTGKIKILAKEIKSIQDKKYLAIDVANTGNLFLNPKLILKFYDDKGSLKNTMDHLKERLYPNNSQRYLIPIDGVKPGKYTAFLLFDNGDNNLFGDTFPIELP